MERFRRVKVTCMHGVDNIGNVTLCEDCRKIAEELGLPWVDCEETITFLNPHHVERLRERLAGKSKSTCMACAFQSNGKKCKYCEEMG